MLRQLVVLAASLMLAIPASAGLISFTLSQTTIGTAPGGNFDPTCQNLATLECVIFSGTISFTTEQDYFVNDIEIAMTSPLVAGNDSYFQVNVPGTFGPDGVTSGSYSGGLFEIDVDPLAPGGGYSGTATLMATDQSGNPIPIGRDTVQDFSVVVVPEPGMFILMFAGLASLAAVGRRYRQK